jgi:hypothetical protein
VPGDHLRRSPPAWAVPGVERFRLETAQEVVGKCTHLPKNVLDPLLDRHAVFD